MDFNGALKHFISKKLASEKLALNHAFTYISMYAMNEFIFISILTVLQHTNIMKIFGFSFFPAKSRLTRWCQCQISINFTKQLQNEFLSAQRRGFKNDFQNYWLIWHEPPESSRGISLQMFWLYSMQLLAVLHMPL